jgi:aromatic-L-amino-acid/L-tryptophan decarboxylase
MNDEILRRLHRETGFIPSATQVDGRFGIRPCFIIPRTTQAEVDGLVDAVVEIGSNL